MSNQDYQEYDAKGNPVHKVPDDLDFEETSSRMQIFFKIFALLGAVGFIAIIWYAYNQGKTPEGTDQVPIVEADPSPTKVKPENEGGLVVPHQDIAVLNEGEEEVTTERLLPPPEMPLPIPSPEEAELEQPEAPKMMEATEEVADGETENLLTLPEPPQIPPADPSDIDSPDTMEPVIVMEEPVEETVEEVMEAVEQAVTETISNSELPPAPEAEATEVVEKQATEVEAKADVVEAPVETEAKQVAEEISAVEEKPNTAVATGDYRIQLASVRTEAKAQAGWENFTKKHKSILGSLSLHIEKADLGAKGIYYRIQAGEMPKSKATSLCSALKSQGTDCLVVKK